MRFLTYGAKNKVVRFFPLVLSMCILCVLLTLPSTVSAAASGDELVDIKSHWAETVIRKWVSQGLAKGYGDGRFGPNDSITRAEFVTLLNRIFGYERMSNKSFPDVKAGAWYAGEIAKAYQTGIISGDNKGNMNPEAVISRQEAVVILTRAFSLTGDHLDAALKYADVNQIAEWALGAVGTMTKRGYVTGRPGNVFAPKDNLSRAEAVKMIDNVMGELIKTAGTYTRVVPGNMVVSSPGITLKDTYIAGDLYLTEGVGSNTIQLVDVVVKGRTIVADGIDVRSILTPIAQGDTQIQPTPEPTSKPIPQPTNTPGSTAPTTTPGSPSAPNPTAQPTATPTQGPTATPTQTPTVIPTQGPTATPTQSPTTTPTQGPTATPTPDTEPPSIPTNLTGIASTAISLSWTASSDNVGVKSYKIYRDELQIGETESIHYSDTGITTGSQVRYTVTAFDAAGNESGESQALIKAASCDYSDVKAAVDTTQSGDTVLLPAGNSVWVNELTVPDNKKITFMGSGPDVTIISTNDSSPKGLINIGASGSRISGITFQLSDETSSMIIVRGKGWRVDHCRFDNIGSVYGKHGVYARGYSSDEGSPVGLIDHCEFNDIRIVVQGDASLMANKIWAQPLGLGTNNAVFIEDCVYHFDEFGNGIDANYGGRYVFRYNVLNDAYIEAHSVQGTHRATRSWEVYGNVINQIDRSMWAPFFIRGGTGVIFDNLLTGKWGSGPAVIFDNVRSFSDVGEGGLADGTSPWDGNEDSTGYPARDQIGRSTDAWLWTDENPYPPQEHDPAYLWNNKHEGKDLKVIVHNNCGHHIKENRDFYNGTGKLNYVPYPYPHPLTTKDYPGKNRVLALTLSGNKLVWNAITDAANYVIQKDWQETVTVDAQVQEYVISEGSVYYVKALDADGHVLSAEGILR